MLPGESVIVEQPSGIWTRINLRNLCDYICPASRDRKRIAQIQRFKFKELEHVKSKKSSNFFGTCSMGTQKAIAAKIVEQEADYVLALRGNQSALHDTR